MDARVRSAHDGRKSSRAPVSPALFCWPRLWFGNGLRLGIGLGRILLRSASIRLGSKVARRRLFGTLGRKQRRNGRHRLIDIPLADAVAAAPLRQIEVDVILMVAVRTGAEHGG